MRGLAVLLVLGALPAAAGEGSGLAEPKRQIQWPECYCTDTDGKRVEIGDLACLRVGGKPFMAQCEMARSQNNPIWRKVEESCRVEPVSLLGGGEGPA